MESQVSLTSHNGKKQRNLAGGTAGNVVAQLVTLWAMTHQWSSEQEQAVIAICGVIIGLASQLYGIISAALFAWEEYLATMARIAETQMHHPPLDNPNPAGGK